MNENLAIRESDHDGVCIPFTIKATLHDLVQDWTSKIDFPSREAADDWLARNRDNPDAIKVEPQGPGTFRVIIAS